jgi:hypothetical protein
MAGRKNLMAALQGGKYGYRDSSSMIIIQPSDSFRVVVSSVKNWNSLPAGQ